MADDGDVCGSIRVVETVEGNEARTRWCSRLEGACPFAGAPESSASERHCPASRRFKVVYADDRLESALAELSTAWHAAMSEGAIKREPVSSSTLAVAKDCLRAALGIEDG